VLIALGCKVFLPEKDKKIDEESGIISITYRMEYNEVHEGNWCKN